MKTRNPKKWSGRFAQSLDPRIERFNASSAFDGRLAPFDIQGSLAHARMLTRQQILTRSDGIPIQETLRLLGEQVAGGEALWDPAAEDIHSAIEHKLVEVLGDSGKRLHTGRSRNDQVATALRLYVRSACDEVADAVAKLLVAILDQAEMAAGFVMPGFTHLQSAQPVTFGHHLMAYCEMLERDRDRLARCRARMNVCPLGAAALAGTSFPVDRAATANDLGFDAVARNSIDAVSDRDFVLDFLHAASVLMVHLSRFAEELILWTSAPFGFVELADAHCTGSSIMPQKKNPDVPELVRGKAGRVTGHLMAVTMTMKGQPLAYNKDNQECQEAVYDTHDTLLAVLDVMSLLVSGLRPQAARMRAAAELGYATATDLADQLVREGVPFRDAHEIVARAVAAATLKGCALEAVGVQGLRALIDEVLGEGNAVSPVITDAWLRLATAVDASVAARNHTGGTAPECVRREVEAARARLHGDALYGERA